MTLYNQSTMDSSDPVAITILPGPTVDRPAIDIINEYLDVAIAFTNALVQAEGGALDAETLLQPFVENVRICSSWLRIPIPLPSNSCFSLPR